MDEITNSKLLEELKKRLGENKKLNNEIGELTEQLKAVNNKLEESEALKSNFISNIRNEIINPFASILAISKHIARVKKEDWKQVISLAFLIYNEAFSLDFQLKNIFAAAEIEAGEINAEIFDVDICQFINIVIDTYKHEANKRKITIDLSFQNLETGTFIKTDPGKLKLIFSNLLSNAVKFSYDEGNVLVKAWRNDKVLNVSVQNYGKGIEEGGKKIIFDRFKQICLNINTINAGHGLGLSVVKALIGILDGKIKITSQKEKGTKFTVSIPESMSEANGFASDGDEFLFDDEVIY